MLALLSFFRTALGQIVAVALAGAVSFGAGYWKGDAHRAALCQADALRSQIAALQRDIDASRAAKADADRRIAALNVEQSERESIIHDYEARLAKRSDASCDLSDDDLRRLRSVK